MNILVALPLFLLSLASHFGAYGANYTEARPELSPVSSDPKIDCEFRGGVFSKVCMCGKTPFSSPDICIDGKHYILKLTSYLLEANAALLHENLKETCTFQSKSAVHDATSFSCKCTSGPKKGQIYHPLVDHCGDIDYYDQAIVCPQSAQEWGQFLNTLLTKNRISDEDEFDPDNHHDHFVIDRFSKASNGDNKLNVTTWTPTTSGRYGQGQISIMSSDGARVIPLNRVTNHAPHKDLSSIVQRCMKLYPGALKTKACTDSITAAAKHFKDLPALSKRVIPSTRLKGTSPIEMINGEHVVNFKSYLLNFNVTDRDYALNNPEVSLESLERFVDAKRIEELRNILIDVPSETEQKTSGPTFRNQRAIDYIQSWKNQLPKNHKIIRVRSVSHGFDRQLNAQGRIYLFAPGESCDRHIQIPFPLRTELEKANYDKSSVLLSQLSQVVVCHHKNGKKLKPAQAYIRDYYVRWQTKKAKHLRIWPRITSNRNLNMRSCTECHYAGYMYYNERAQLRDTADDFEDLRTLKAINQNLKQKYAAMMWATRKSPNGRVERATNPEHQITWGINTQGNRAEVVERCLSHYPNELAKSLNSVIHEGMKCVSCHNGRIQAELSTDLRDASKTFDLYFKHAALKRHPSKIYQKAREAYAEADKTFSAARFSRILYACMKMETLGRPGLPGTLQGKLELNCGGERVTETSLLASRPVQSKRFGKAIHPFSALDFQSITQEVKEINLANPNFSTQLCTDYCREKVDAKIKVSATGRIEELVITKMNRYDSTLGMEVPVTKEEREIIAQWIKNEVNKYDKSVFFGIMLRDSFEAAHLIQDSMVGAIDGYTGPTRIYVGGKVVSGGPEDAPEGVYKGTMAVTREAFLRAYKARPKLLAPFTPSVRNLAKSK